MQASADAVIVGAGPAGSSVALFLARQGFEVVLLDKARFPRDKACGEGIMPHGVAILEELGLRRTLIAQGARPFRGLKYWTADGDSVEGEFPDDAVLAEGLVVKRLLLDETLVAAARREPGVTVLEGARATELILGDVPGGGRGPVGVAGIVESTRERLEIRAALTVGADGLHSKVRSWLGLDMPVGRHLRWGIRGHLRGVAKLGPHVEVILHEGGEIYMTRCGPDEALVALLLDKAAMGRFRARSPEVFVEFLRTSPALRDRLRDVELPADLMASGPLATTARRPFEAGALLVGDSAGALDPITAEGIALALRGAKLAAETAATALREGDLSQRSLSRYARRWRRDRRDFERVTSLVLWICRHPRLAGRAVRRFRRQPGLFSKLLGVSVGSSPYSGIGSGEKLRFLLGV